MDAYCNATTYMNNSVRKKRLNSFHDLQNRTSLADTDTRFLDDVRLDPILQFLLRFHTLVFSFAPFRTPISVWPARKNSLLKNRLYYIQGVRVATMGSREDVSKWNR